VDGSEEENFHQISIIPPMAQIALQQIINCPYRASLKKLFLESKVLELVASGMAQLEHTSDAIFNIELGTDAMARVLEARNILLGNLETPPSLLELAKQIGTNRTTLNKGFHHFLGTSVFDYLRTQRLEKARELLHNKNMSISQAAHHVGYSHQSSFTRAYKKYFGTYPTAHLRQAVTK
jgi:AraC-like DNA-binding protein